MKIKFTAHESEESFEIEDNDDGETISLFIRELLLRYGGFTPEILSAIADTWERYQDEEDASFDRFDFSDPENNFSLVFS